MQNTIQNIGIIGGGWYGCYIAEYLLDKYENVNITIIDENNGLFEGSSYKNQNRLHLGFHYPRCNITRNKCKIYFDEFKSKYNDLICEQENNYYVISNKSNINFDEFINLYDEEDYNLKENKQFTNIQKDIVNTNEMYIDFTKVKKYFNEKFKEKFKDKVKFIFNYYVYNLSVYHDNKTNNNCIIVNDELQFYKVFNCTYNQLNSHLKDSNIIDNLIYEKCLTLLYKKVGVTEFDCLTIMDGEFSSIYYYNKTDNGDLLYTLTNVQHTPLIKNSKFENVKNYDNYDLNNKIKLFEENIMYYYPFFKKKYEYFGYFESYKCKNNSEHDSRDINISIKDNVFNVWCGKISFVFELNEKIDNFISL
jgi:hypothetical protein